MLKKISIEDPDSEEDLVLVDQDGKELCYVNRHTDPGEAMLRVTQAICKAAGIEFDSCGFEHDVPGPSLVERIQSACVGAEGPEALIGIGEMVGLTEDDFKV